jgi:hypothetical protein
MHDSVKVFAIGDGQKKITCPNRYLADEESSTTIVIWDPANRDMPIRVTVITVVPKDSKEEESGYWSVINEARKKSAQPQIFQNKAVYEFQQLSGEPGYRLHFFQVGMGNHTALFSITVAAAVEQTCAFTDLRADLIAMIESLVERKPDEQFDCNLELCEEKRIQAARDSLLGEHTGDEGWKILNDHYKRALDAKDNDLGAQIGLAFGELLRHEVPTLYWKVKIDEYGRARSLDLRDEKISIFPEAMILKRLDRGEVVDFADLSSGTIDAIEDLYRKYQAGRQE